MPGKSAISLRFERDDPCNTTIVDQDGNIVYTVATEFPSSTWSFRRSSSKRVTRVHDGIGKLVAEWTWGDARSDLLTMAIRGRPEPLHIRE